VEIDPKLPEKIKTLRAATGLSRAEFSKKLGVSRAQLSMWEKGRENPTNQKFIALGNLADEALHQNNGSPISIERTGAICKLAERPDSQWFWQEAGINLSAIERSIRQKKIKRDPSAGGEVVGIRRPDTAALLQYVERGGAVNARSLAGVEIPFPALFVSDPNSTICVQATDRVAGSPFHAGDLCLVRLSTRKREKANAKDSPNRSLENLAGRSVAALYKSLPNERELSPDAARWHSQNRHPIGPTIDYDPKQLRSQITPAEEKQAKKYLADATRPGILLGTLRIQSDASWSGDLKHLNGERPWRLVLDCGGTWNGLTNWSTEEFPEGALHTQLKAGISILGPIIGWLRAPSETGEA
jgi:transcriptional regulator with XRE-family HTH domain